MTTEALAPTFYRVRCCADERHLRPGASFAAQCVSWLTNGRSNHTAGLIPLDNQRLRENFKWGHLLTSKA